MAVRVRTRAPRAKRQQRAALLGAPLPTAREVDVRCEKTCRRQTDAQYVRRVGSSISGGAGKSATGQESLDCLERRQLHLRCATRRGGGRLPVEEYER